MTLSITENPLAFPDGDMYEIWLSLMPPVVPAFVRVVITQTVNSVFFLAGDAPDAKRSPVAPQFETLTPFQQAAKERFGYGAITVSEPGYPKRYATAAGSETYRASGEMIRVKETMIVSFFTITVSISLYTSLSISPSLSLFSLYLFFLSLFLTRVLRL